VLFRSPALAEHFLASAAQELSVETKVLKPETKEYLQHLPWPGNVRQLINALRNVVVLNDGPVVTEAMLPPDLIAEATPPPDAGRPAGPTAALHLDDLIGRPLAEIEQIVIEATLARYDGSVPRASRKLEVSPSTLYRKLESWRQHRDAAE